MTDEFKLMYEIIKIWDINNRSLETKSLRQLERISRSLPWKRILRHYTEGKRECGPMNRELPKHSKREKNTRFYALKCALLTFCNAFFIKKWRLNASIMHINAFLHLEHILLRVAKITDKIYYNTCLLLSTIELCFHVH